MRSSCRTGKLSHALESSVRVADAACRNVLRTDNALQKRVYLPPKMINLLAYTFESIVG